MMLLFIHFIPDQPPYPLIDYMQDPNIKPCFVILAWPKNRYNHKLALALATAYVHIPTSSAAAT